MELATEDSFRLNVLLKQDNQAIRIDESSMTVHALTSRGEARVKLNPTCRDQPYLRLVRELISTHVLGSPGGYPVYLRRWTRMGQARDDSLRQLLLLGEPEAVVAVVHATGLTDELARRAWWAMPESDNARRMLEKPSVVAGAMGAELAGYLLEYLPFETESRNMIDSIRLVLQPGLIDEQSKLELWKKAARKTAYYVGFLLGCPDRLPLDPVDNTAKPVVDLSHPLHRQLQKALDKNGQAFLATVLLAAKKPNDQDVVTRLLQAVAAYFDPGDLPLRGSEDIEQLQDRINRLLPSLTLSHDDGELRPRLAAIMLLCGLNETLVNPIFSRSDAIGSVMRKKIEPVFGPLMQACLQLRSP